MSRQDERSESSAKKIDRRKFLVSGAGAVAATAVGSRFLRAAKPAVTRLDRLGLVAEQPTTVEVHLAATDGFVSMPPGTPAIPPFWPDPLAPSPQDMYVFGFRDVTGLSAAEVNAVRGHAQISAPLLAFDEGQEVKLTLSNLGLAVRPDLTDSHTVHWHGFKNAIPLFDGVPELSVAVPPGRDFTYYYRPHAPGTYMYHCHFEDVEHVQMGMTGLIFVRPAMNTAFQKYAYNDASTAYDREFATLLTEVWAEGHYRDAHIQESDWTEFKPSFWLMNGRAYPDTLAPNGNPLTAPDTDRLKYQPNSSLVTANVGDRVLLRVANLGYQNHSLTLDGLDLKVVGKDASFLQGRDGTDNSFTTNAFDIGPGESRDVIFTASTPGTYLLYDRDYAYLNNGGGAGYGGQMTEIRIGAAGTYPPQTLPNT